MHGPPIKALLTHNFLLFPPDNRPLYLFIYSSNCIVYKKYVTDSVKSSPDNPFILPNKYKCSFGVKFSQMQSNYGHIPTS